VDVLQRKTKWYTSLYDRGNVCRTHEIRLNFLD